MEIRLAISTFDLVERGDLTVTRACRDLGVSRDTFYRYRYRYRYRARFAEQGVVGLLPVSSRPASSPGKTPAMIEELVVAMRQELLKEGWDAGAVRSMRG